jgi:hypothetical protein
MAFQAEWYEKKQDGSLGDEDVGVMPDVYARNDALNEQCKQLSSQLAKARKTAETAKATWAKFRQERDYHRMHHRRVVQEKDRLRKDMARLREHIRKNEPLFEAMRGKYEHASKERMMMKLERDRHRSRAKALAEQLHQWESSTSLDGTLKAVAVNGGGGGGGVNRKKKGNTASSASLKSTASTSSKAASKRGGAGVGGGVDSVLPPDERVNPYLARRFEPAPVERMRLVKTFQVGAV